MLSTIFTLITKNKYQSTASNKSIRNLYLTRIKLQRQNSNESTSKKRFFFQPATSKTSNSFDDRTLWTKNIKSDGKESNNEHQNRQKRDGRTPIMLGGEEEA